MQCVCPCSMGLADIIRHYALMYGYAKIECSVSKFILIWNIMILFYYAMVGPWNIMNKPTFSHYDYN